MSIIDTICSCEETPVWTPSTLNPSSLPACLSCTLRLSSKLPGTGNISTESAYGINIDENPTTEFVVNGARYNLTSVVLSFPGLHRLYGNQTVCDGEMLIFFRHIFETTKTVVLCVPIQKNETGSPYFKTLGTIEKNRPVLSSLIDPDTEIISYPGPSLEKRTAKDGRPRDMCNPISKPTNYYVCLSPTKISFADFDRLYLLRNKEKYSGPPRPLADLSTTRAMRLLTRITEISLEGSLVQKESDDGVPTKALKCYKLDIDKDIKDNKVYIGGGAKKQNTLEKELQKAADLSGDIPPDNRSIKPGDIESIVGIIFGVTIAVIVCATIAYYLWKLTFTHYLPTLKLYENPLSTASLSAKIPSFSGFYTWVCGK